MKQYVFGIDVGGTSIKCGLFQITGTILEKWEILTRTEDSGEHILDDVAASIKAMIDERQMEADEIIGVGIGVPGPVRADGFVGGAVNLGWGEKDITGELKEKTGLNVKAGNDANVAALGELWQGGRDGFKDLLMVTLGTAVGGGVIVDGKIVTGAHGAGGEIGHTNVNPQEVEACNCGSHGCLEHYASATGIVRMAKKMLAKSNEASILRDDDVTAKAVFDAYKEEDALAIKIVEKFAEILGRALAIHCCVVDPGVIVIGGGVSKAGQVLIDVVNKYFVRYAFSACRNTKMELAQLGNDAGIYGAAKLIIDEA